MPTEDDARLLLAKAAATIDVEESAPLTLTGLPEPPHRRWAVLAAAAAVVVAIAGGLLVAQQAGDGPQPAPPAPSPTHADREPVEQEHVYGDDEMPSLVGYTENEATDLLTRRGYALEVVAVYSCDQPRGYVLSTEPGAGTRMRPGDEVLVRVTGGPSPAARCVPPTGEWQQVLDLVRFARGLGPAPDFPEEVSTRVGDGEWTTLSATEAEGPENWVLCDGDQCHSALAALAETVTAPRRFLAVDEGSPRLCPLPQDQGLPFHVPSYVFGNEPTDGIFCPPLPVLEIGWTEDWRIAGVELHLEYLEPDPDGASDLVDRPAIAESFVDWARGDGPAPEFADEVRILLSGYDFGSLDGAAAPRLASWRLRCPRFMSAPCPESAVQVLREYDGPTVRVPSPTQSCFTGKGRVSADLASLAPADLVRIDRPGGRPCHGTSLVELWIDDAGRIYAVDSTRLFG